MQPGSQAGPAAHGPGTTGHTGLVVADPTLVRDDESRLNAIAATATRNEYWLRRYAFWLVFLDLTMLVLAGTITASTYGSNEVAAAQAGLYAAMSAGLPLAWMAALALSRCYETRFLGEGPEEYRRVGNAALKVMAVAAVASFLLELPFAQGFGVPFLLAGTVALLLGRVWARAVLHAGRRRTRWTHRVLVVGSRGQAADLAGELSRSARAGYCIVGAVIPGGDETPLRLHDDTTVPVAGKLTRLGTAVLATGADTVAVAAGPETSGEGLRLLSYELEGTGVDLLVAPALASISGTRVSIRPVAGLPLLHLDEPELTGARKVVKQGFDLVTASLLVLLLLPVLAGIAALVRATSPGPALFVQERVGLRGSTFRVLKFRTMSADAEQRLAELAHLNEHDGVLFKVREDPRITRVGAVLRKYSLDELPQLFNVLRREMALVGPRPPLPTEVARYQGHAHRRLLVKPGITGLWQVSGRSELSWDETVRLDLQYVENWSLALDISILTRTAITVLTARGAY
ncbi:MAG: sugar transferase [Actinobacteria bacterium]|nr:sugar transferase [Actinomycetota bacterium]